MNSIYSYSKISERLAVLLCDRTQRDPRLSICQHEAVQLVEPNCSSGLFCQHEASCSSGLSISAGIKAWLESRGTPYGFGPDSRSYVYPIGGRRDEAHDKFWEAERKASMWRGEYGQERKELLRFLIRWYREKGL